MKRILLLFTMCLITSVAYGQASSTEATQSVTNNLMTPLTQAELAQKDTELAILQQQVDQLEAQTASVLSDFKTQMATLVQQRADVAVAIRDKQAMKDIPCTKKIDLVAATITTTRNDTGKIIQVEKITVKP